jgi:hypothetical protein
MNWIVGGANRKNPKKDTKLIKHIKTGEYDELALPGAKIPKKPQN